MESSDDAFQTRFVSSSVCTVARTCPCCLLDTPTSSDTPSSWLSITYQSCQPWLTDSTTQALPWLTDNARRKQGRYSPYIGRRRTPGYGPDSEAARRGRLARGRSRHTRGSGASRPDHTTCCTASTPTMTSTRARQAPAVRRWRPAEQQHTAYKRCDLNVSTSLHTSCNIIMIYKWRWRIQYAWRYDNV